MAADTQTRRMALRLLLGALIGGGTLFALAAHWRQRDASRDAVRQPAAAPASDAAILTGRCVDARTGSPIAGARLYLNGSDPVPPTIHDERKSWRMEPARTDADGRFRLTLTPPAGLWYDLGILADGYVIATSYATLAPGTEEDLGEIQLRSGGRIIGRVVDTTGAPRARVSFGLRHCEADYRERGMSRCTSRDDGTFATDCLLPGTWSLQVDDVVPLKSPLVFEVPDDASDAEVTVVLFADDEVPSNEGVVLDEDGQPVPNAKIGRGLVADDRGRFRHPVGPTSDAARSGSVSYFPTKHGYEADPAARSHPVGAGAIELRMHRAPLVAIDLAVVDETSGMPLEAYDAVCVQRHADFPGWERGWVGVASALGPHPGGRTRLVDVTPGERTILVRPRDDRSALVHATRITVSAAGADVVVRVPPAAERRLEVVSPTGAAVVDTLVEVLLPLDDRALSLTSSTLEAFELLMSAHNDPVAVTLHTVRTDRDGRAVIRGPAERALCVRILGPGHVPEVRERIYLDGAPLRVTVREGATLLGRLPVALREGLRGVHGPSHRDRSHHSWSTSSWSLADAIGGVNVHEDPGAYGLRLTGPSAESTLPSRSHVYPIDADGRFLIEGLVPGRWTIQLRVPSLDDAGTWLALGPAPTREGDVLQLKFDDANLEPGILRGTLRADGRPLAHRVVRFAPLALSSPGMLESGTIAGETDAHGRFEIRLLAGRWRPAIVARGVVNPGGHGDPTWVTLPGEFDVRAGAVTDADLAFHPRRLTVRVVDAAHHPLRFQRTTVAIDSDGLGNMLTDCEGRVVIDPLLGDTPLVQFSQGDHGRGSVRVPAAPRDPELTVVLQ